MLLLISSLVVNTYLFNLPSLGNHEFDNGIYELIPFIEKLTCPVLAANLITDKVPELEKLSNLKKSVIFNISGTKIGIVGYLTPETKKLTKKNNVEYINEIEAIITEVAKLQKAGVKIIIALGHSGYIEEQKIAKEVDGLDLVIGGHSHSFLWNGTIPDIENSVGPYPTYVQQASGKYVPVVQAYAYTKYIGQLHLIFDFEGNVVSLNGRPLLLDRNVPEDEDMLLILAKYRKDVERVSSEVVGNTSVILDATVCEKEECNLGNLITDSVIHYYAFNYKGDHWTDAPIAVIQAGGIRASIAHAKMPMQITKEDLLTVMPFGGNLVTVTMNGTLFFQMLEISVRRYGEPRVGEFLQYSGVKVIYNVSKPAGSRVVKALARCWACNVPMYSPVEDKQIYTVIMPDFVAAGGDGYAMLKNLSSNILPFNELHSTQYYLSKHSPVAPEIGGRITILDSTQALDKIDNNYTNSVKNSYCSLSLSIAIFTMFSSLGNHELDEAVDGLVPFIRNLTAPVLAANLILDNVPELQDEPNLHKSVILNIDGVKIGIIGYLTPETKFLAPRNKIEYEDEVTALRREVKNLKNEGVTIFIALGHSGYIKDLEIGKQVEDIDLVIGGHSNTFLWNSNTTEEIPEYPQGPYPMMVTQPWGRKVPIVQAFAYTKYIGKLHLTFDTNGEIIEYDGTPLLLNQAVPRDPDLVKVVDEYHHRISLIMNEVVGSSMVALIGENCRLYECNIGNLINDAMLYYTKKYYYVDHGDVNIAITQGGRIRASIVKNKKAPYNLTREDWLSVLPFSDSLSVINLNGTILKKALEHSVDTWRTIDSTGQFLQMSGMKVVYDLARPAGFRVVKAEAICSSCDNPILKDIQDDFEYKIITSTFIADSGDGYNMFEGLVKETLLYNELTSIISYLKVYSPVSPKVENRIQLLNSEVLRSNTVFDGFVPEVKQIRSLPNRAYSTSCSQFHKLLMLILCFCLIGLEKMFFDR